MKSPETTLISITCADDSIVLFSFVTVEYLTSGAPRWVREDSIEEIEKEITKSTSSWDKEKLPIKSWIKVNREDVPTDRTFRNALRHDGDKFHHCLVTAKNIKKAEIRREREALFLENDLKLRDAIIENNVDDIQKYVKIRNSLRNATSHPLIVNAKSINDLKDVSLDKVI
jgi:hypothetical protein